MAVPLTLSSVPNVLPYNQYIATAGQTSFPYTFPITQDSDLVAIVGITTLPTDSGYTLTGQGNSTGGNVIFTTGLAAGTIVTFFRDIAIERITQFSQNSGFSSTAFNAEFNNIYLILQQLEESINFCLQIPNTNSPAPVTTLTAAAYANKYQYYDAYGNPQPAANIGTTILTQALILSLISAQTPAELAAAVVPVNLVYNPGYVQRYYVSGSYDTAIADAILQASEPYGSPMNLFGQTVAVTGNIANLHTTPKQGTGAITRGGSTFYVNIGSTQTNSLYRSLTGMDTNDGIRSGFPFLTLQAQLNAAFQNYGPVLQGNWAFPSAAGTYTDQAIMTPNFESVNPIVISGPGGALVGAAIVPTYIQEGGGTLPYWLSSNGNNKVVLENVLWQNYNSGGNATAVVFQTFSFLELINGYGINNDLDFKNEQGRTYVVGGVFQGGTAGCTLISGETHSLGYDATQPIPGNLVVTGVSGTGATATITFTAAANITAGSFVVGAQYTIATTGTTDYTLIGAANSSPGTVFIATGVGAGTGTATPTPLVGGFVAVTGFTAGAAGYNGLYLVTASSTTSISYANATTAATAGTPVFAYNIGCAGYGPTFYGKSNYAVLAQENATGHLDYGAIINCTVGAEVLVSSRFNAHFELFQGNATCAVECEQGGTWSNNSCNLGTSNGTTQLLYGSSTELLRMGKWTLSYKMPIDAVFYGPTSGTTLSSAVIKTYTAVLDWAGFNNQTKKFVVKIVGTMKGTDAVKSIFVLLDGSLVGGATTASTSNGDFVNEVHCTAYGPSQQSVVTTHQQNGILPIIAEEARSITPSAGTITIEISVNALDSISIRTVEIWSEGGA